MPDGEFGRSVFVNCPFDEQYAPLLEAALFCIVYLGFVPRLANERLDGGENRHDKIVDLIKSCKYSIHDLSRSRAKAAGEVFRMNMPYEYGVDVGLRRSGAEPFDQKKFLIFEEKRFDLKPALSDIAGQDVESHEGNFQEIIRHVRDFFWAEAGVKAPGPSRIEAGYTTFQGWMTEKKIHEGHSEKQALRLPTLERLHEMKVWNDSGRPAAFIPED